MTAAELAAILVEVPVAEVPAVRFYLAWQGAAVDTGWLLENRKEIRAALADLDRQVAAVKEIGRGCLSLRPSPARTPPVGI